MKIKGRVFAVRSNLISIETEPNSDVRSLIGCNIEIEKRGEKRSLDSNAYFHLLVGRIADKLNISKPRCKNILLGRYGQRDVMDGKPVIISVMSHIDMMEREDIHTIAVGYGHVQEKEFTHYAVVRGSHTYTRKEMSALIAGTVDEAKELGIETMTPEELQSMMSAWRSHEKKINPDK